MALADVTVPDCSFHWDIQNPFTAPRVMFAYFYHGITYISPWQVWFRPVIRRINCWTFTFCLGYKSEFVPEVAIIVSRVQVGIFFNNRCIASRDDSNVLLKISNNYTYQFDVYALVNQEDQQDQELLVIKVKLEIPSDFPESLSDIGFDADMRLLSEDLRRLLINYLYSDMQLLSTDNHVIPVHTCILNARWKKCLENHSLDANFPAGVQVSFRVLWDILIFLYSGEVRFGWPYNTNVEYMTELWHVIFSYEMRDLITTIKKREMAQRRISRRDVSTVTYNFPLENMLPGFSQEYRVNENTRYDFVFTISVQMSHGGWLSYELTSNSEIQVYVQVNLDLRKAIVETRGTSAHTYYETTYLHHNDYLIHPDTSRRLDNVLFLGCPETFTFLNKVKSLNQRIEIWDSVICTLKFTDGIITEQIQSVVIETAEQEERYRRYLLGNDLLKLYFYGVEQDLYMVTPIESENTLQSHCAHEPIFKARVTRWWNVFQNAREDAVMPCPAFLPLKIEALVFVFMYIYSGRTHVIPPYLLDDIQHFAEQGEFHALINYIERLRSLVHDSSDSGLV